MYLVTKDKDGNLNFDNMLVANQSQILEWTDSALYKDYLANGVGYDLIVSVWTDANLPKRLREKIDMALAVITKEAFRTKNKKKVNLISLVNSAIGRS